MKAKTLIKIGYDFQIWIEYQVKQPLDIDLRTHPSQLITGSSGSGKSYALKWELNSLLEHDTELTFCNFKRSDDFRFLTAYERYYTYLECADGLKDFYGVFKNAQDSETEYNGKFHIMVFDEFPAFILSTAMADKKLAEQYKAMISEILMLGRSYGFGVWLVMQRPDASFLANGARDNFQTTISLGNISKETKSMLYSGGELPERIYKAGEGICWIDGTGLREIKFPKIRDMCALETKILNRLRLRP